MNEKLAFNPGNLRLIDVFRRAGKKLIADGSDEILRVGPISPDTPAEALMLPLQTRFPGLGGLRPQVRVAEERKKQLVEGRRLVGCAVGSIQAECIAPGVTPTDPTRRFTAEHLVIIPTQRGNQLVTVKVHAVLSENTDIIPAGPGIIGRTPHLVIPVVHTKGQ